MKIFYDNIIFSLQRAGGISIYWTELIKRFKGVDDISFCEYENDNIFRKTLDIKTQPEVSFDSKFVRYFPFLFKLSDKTIFHSSYYRISLNKNVVNITTVHDFTYEYFMRGLAKFIHSWQKGLAIKKSDGVICVSENTKRDLIKFYPFVDESKIRVIYNGVGKEFTKLDDKVSLPNEKLSILREKEYILFVGDRSPYKNFNIVLDVLNNLTGYQLIVVGGKTFNTIEKQKSKDSKIDVTHLTGLSSEELNFIYNNAFCLLYPSSYEGFGIPVIEAMKAGCPVISANSSSIPEVAGNAGLLIDNISVKDILKEINKLKRPEFRTSLIEKGFKQASKFSWDYCYNETRDFYKTVWDKKFNKNRP